MEWYLSYDGNRIGPLSDAEAKQKALENPGGLAWRQGFAQWLPISKVGELCGVSSISVTPPPTDFLNSDEVDFRIFGTEMQFVEVELDPGESAIAEAGAMMYKDSSIEMDTIFGDGSAQSRKGGLMDKLVGAGKRVLTGESLFMTQFTHQGHGKGNVAFGAPYPGNVLPLSLKALGGSLICQKDSFLCAARGVSVAIFFQRKMLTGLFGGEGFIMQKLDGDGMVFVHAGGTVVERKLAPGEVLHADTGCIVAFQPGVNFDIQQAGNVKTMLFGGEGFFFARLQGPGTVWLQSLPFSRLAGRMLRAAPQGGGRDKGEGSLLGGIGNLLNGDNSF